MILSFTVNRYILSMCVFSGNQPHICAAEPHPKEKIEDEQKIFEAYRPAGMRFSFHICHPETDGEILQGFKAGIRLTGVRKTMSPSPNPRETAALYLTPTSHRIDVNKR